MLAYISLQGVKKWCFSDIKTIAISNVCPSYIIEMGLAWDVGM
jgi:hypothetical protein